MTVSMDEARNLIGLRRHPKINPRDHKTTPLQRPDRDVRADTKIKCAFQELHTIQAQRDLQKPAATKNAAAQKEGLLLIGECELTSNGISIEWQRCCHFDRQLHEIERTA